MEGLNNTSSNNSQQQMTSSETTPFISNLTTIAPISSQVVDDFQSDPKWEFTPLEKASLDCIEMEAASFDTGNTDQQMEQNIESLSQDRRKFGTSGDADGDAQDQQSQQQQHASAEESGSRDQIDESKTTHNLGDEVGGVDSNEADIQEFSNINELASPKQEMEPSDVIAEEIIETGQPPEVESIITESFPPPEASINVSTGDSKKQPKASASVATSHQPTDELSQSDIGKQQKAHDPREDISASNNATIFLSQTSVDAQMEKVIDNAVELGGGQHFGQVYERSEDKAKVLESIHREITSDRSSMEIMADIALQQLPLVTESVGEQRTNEQANSIEEKGAPTKEKSSKNDDLTKGLAKPPDQETAILKTEEIISEEIVEEPEEPENIFIQQSEVKADDHKTGTSCSTAAKIEEVQGISAPNAASGNTQMANDSDIVTTIVEEPQEAAVDTEESAEQQSTSVVVESVENMTEPLNEVHVVPVVEEVASEEEQANNEAKTSEIGKDAASSQEERQEKPDPEPFRRRSGRARTKVEMKDFEETLKLETRKTPGRNKGSSRKQRKAEDEVANNCDVDSVKIQEQQVTEPELTKPQVERVNEQVFERSEVPEEPEKPTRSMRTRTPKRFETTQEEPVKRQVKRSRLTVDNDLNKSYEAAKNTPMIKLPTQRSRATISTSNPSARPTPPSQRRKRSPSSDANDSSIEKKYACTECNFSTDRLNNVVFHYTKSYCPGKCQMVEVMKADIIKQQQTPKGNKNKRLAR